MINEKGIALYRTWNIGSYPVGIGIHAHHLALNLSRSVAQKDGIIEALAHLCLPIDAHQRGYVSDNHFGNGKNLSIQRVETPGNLPCYLNVSHIIFSHRNHVRLYA